MFFTPLSDLLVGEYHELFDQLVSIVSFPFFDIYWSLLYSFFPIILELKIYLRRLECDFPFFSASFFEEMVEGGRYRY